MDFIRPVQAARRRTDMERLTYDFALGGNHCWQVKGADNLECREVCQCQEDKGCKDCPIAKAFDRLAAIEDILGDEYDLDELKEVVQAKREGRCIVLPCKKGDTVWRIVHDAAPHITKDRCTDIKYENRDIWVHLIGDRVMGGWNFGKLLFLTREEAEDALRREQE